MRLRVVFAVFLLFVGVAAGGDQAPARIHPLWTISERIDNSPELGFIGNHLVMKSSYGLSVYDISTGRLRWRQSPLMGSLRDWASSTGVLVGHFTVPSTGDGTEFIAGIDLATGRLRWRRDGMRSAGDWRSGGDPAPVIMVWDQNAGRLTGLDPVSGVTLWTSSECGKKKCDLSASGATRETAVIAMNEGDTATVLFVDPLSGRIRGRRTLPASDNVTARIHEDVVSVLHGETLSAYDGKGRLIVERGGCWNGCSLIQSGGKLIILYGDPHPVVEGVDRATGASAWKRDDLTALDVRAVEPSRIRVTTSSRPLQFSEIDPAGGRTLRSVSLPVDGQIFSRDPAHLYLASTWWPGGTGQLRVSSLGGDLGRQDAPPRDTWPDACSLPVPSSFRIQPSPVDRVTAQRCAFTDHRGASLSVTVAAVMSTPGDAATLMEQGEMAAQGIFIEGVGDQAVIDQDLPRRLTMRVGSLLVDLSTGDERLRGTLKGIAATIGARLPRATGAPKAAVPPVAGQGGPVTRVARTPLFVVDQPSDPVRLRSFTFGGKTYTRTDGSRTYTAGGAGTVSPDGAWSASLSPNYPAAGDHDLVRMTSRATGARRVIPTVKAPLGAVDPYWSADGKHLLMTIERPGADDPAGFAIIDPAAGKASVHLIPKGYRVDGRFGWGGDNEVVALYGRPEQESRMRLTAFDLTGKPVRTLRVRARPIGAADMPVSPSGRLLAVQCVREQHEICVVNRETGETIAHVPVLPNNLIGWYDDSHLIAWRIDARKSSAKVITLAGTDLRTLFALSDPGTSGSGLDVTLSHAPSLDGPVPPR
ncbi:Outer membrane protein assembly factor BamB, contains PQQ-like beta-propeller repeat [Streptosporangium subroseum]|uniref:Outer membrane protein assembly factor BamB, contains PQQ-like beta-propeller repeat n=1 Tax=Streptosporangium subroseum TaxID=106412 RepID=A0A239F1M7_9ACTN|nr:PQQ-binding-like beta-propeller repeat protein [Streptosporangium subroseum]SNS49994.1 Outer membrane protein assembly factor BamB, contains PQQ-like beta-propeller repeat [Streptosporangium subroseum]